MHTIVILSDTLKEDDEVVGNIKKLFPDCAVQICSKTADKPANHHNLSDKTLLYPKKSHRID